MYYIKCKELDLLPIKFRMQLKDIKLLHNILNNNSVISLPPYIKFYSGGNRLRSSHLDNLSLISDINPKISRNYCQSRDVVSSSLSQFSNSFFYRTINNCNLIPLEIRRLQSMSEFELGVRKHLWEIARPARDG